MATNPQLFAAWMTPYAEQASAATGLDVGVIIAQWGNETAWGTEFAEPNNIGNIGVYSGGPNPSYPTLQAGVQAYINFMNSPAMAHAKAQWQGQSPAQQAQIVGASGYAGGQYNNGGGPGSSLIADMQAAGEGGAGAVPGMTSADWQALYAAGQQGGTGYLTAAASQAQTASTSFSSASGGGSSTNVAGATYSGTAQQTSALSTIETDLQNYGFTPSQVQQLTQWAWGEITANVDPSQIAIDLQNQPAFQQQFPYFKQVNQSLESQGQGAMSVSQYVQLTQSYLQTAHAAGLPNGMLTGENMAQLMEGNVSPSELSSRVNSAMSYVLSTPAAQQAFNQYFGTSYSSEITGAPSQMTSADWQALEQAQAAGGGAYLSAAAKAGGPGTNTPLSLGQMAAIVLNPSVAEPLIQQQLTAAQIGGASVTSGVGAIDAKTASELAQAGITPAQATSTFQNIAPYATLETARPGMANVTQGVVSPEQLATGALIGDTAAQRQLQTATEVAKAPFSGGGGFVSNVHGVAGAGSASEQGAGNT